MSHAAPTSPASAIPARLDALRQHLKKRGWQAVLLPSSDPHLSEYLPERWQARQWFSGFTGSAGTLLLTQRRAAVFTDSRYWEQAEAELAGTGIELVKLEGPAVPAFANWLHEQRDETASPVLAVDGAVLGLAMAQALQSALARHDWSMAAQEDPVAACWPERPSAPLHPVYEHLGPYASTPRAEKLTQVRQAMQEQGATHHWIATVDDLAWLLNLRGSDVDYNPVFLAHALVTPQDATLFIDARKVPDEVRNQLIRDGIRCQPYEDALTVLGALPDGACLLVDPKRITWGLRNTVPAGVRVIEAINPSTLAKSRKTEQEASFVRQAMEHDGAAMCAFYAWFESALGKQAITELTIDERLSAERARQPGFVGLSFPTIAGFKANGALPHYRATEQSHAWISTPEGLAGEGLLLIDSGAQYLGGTTDITRVWAIGTPTPAQQRDYTLVLKGTIGLSRARFPVGTPGPMLDALARAPLWAAGMDFGHGTGHGVGYFLNVHEGPQSISKALPDTTMAMQAGMITSIEPGCYRPRQWGIRIENLVLNVPVHQALAHTEPGDPEHGDFLAFETLTLCPIDTRCIDLTLLNAEERQWLNDYHAEVHRRLRPLVSGEALAWLERRTQPI